MPGSDSNGPTTVLDHFRMEFGILAHPKNTCLQQNGSISTDRRARPARLGEGCGRPTVQVVTGDRQRPGKQAIGAAPSSWNAVDGPLEARPRWALDRGRPGALVMSNIPLELERRCEQRWAARFEAARALREQHRLERQRQLTASENPVALRQFDQDHVCNWSPD